MHKNCNLCSYGALYSFSKLFHYNKWFLCKTSLLYAYVQSVFECDFQSNRGCAWCSEEWTSWCGKWHLSEFIVYLENTLWMYNLSSERQMVIILQENYRINCFIVTRHTYHHHQFAIIFHIIIIVHITIICLPLLSIT